MTQEPDKPGPDDPPPDLPEEPFGYLSSPGRLGEPWALIISSGFVALFGVWVLVLAVVTGDSTGGLITAAAIMVVLLAVGGSGIYVGVRRLRWRRAIRRLTGRDPW